MPPIAAIATILSLALLLISNVISGVYALPRNERPLSAQRSVGPCEASRLMDQPNPLQPRSIVMDQTIASFEEQGLCFHYFAERPSWHPDPCIEYCKNHGGHGYDGCDASSYADVDIEHGDQSIIETDDNGFRWVPAPCECSNPNVEEVATSVFDAVAQGLERIDNLSCADWTKALEDIRGGGIDSIPGSQLLTVVGLAVQGAKTFAENGLGTAEFFDNWVGSTCGIPDWSFELWIALLVAPDSLGTSVGCLRKNKSKCKRKDPVLEKAKKYHAEKSEPTGKKSAPHTESNS